MIELVTVLLHTMHVHISNLGWYSGA